MRTDELYSKAMELDEQDKLRTFRDRFHLPPDIIYLDGNSLGACPKSVGYRLSQITDQAWGQRLIRGWNESWIDLPRTVGAKIAGLIGAQPDEVIVCDSTTVNFYKLALAASNIQAGREEVVTEKIGFPTNRYLLQRLFSRDKICYVYADNGIDMPADTIESLLNSNTALLALNHVNYRSGWMHDMKRLNAAAKEQGILNLWDLSHSVGAVPIDLNGSGADLAVGCTYKYLNGGPGAPAFLYVRRDLQEKLFNPIQGWFGQKNFFDFADDYEPEADIRRFLTGTPSILSMAAIEEGLDIVIEAGMDRIREKSVLMSEFLCEVWTDRLQDIGVRLNSPTAPENRGSHISLGHERALRIDQVLIHRMGVIPDFRRPDNIRFGLAPLYNKYVEIFEALERMRLVLEKKSYESFDANGAVIT